jgi:hypothetical protein
MLVLYFFRKDPLKPHYGESHMSKILQAFKKWKIFVICMIYILLSFFLIQTPNTFAADICKGGLKELVSSQGVIQGKGGIWGYLEQSSALKEKSIMGLQIDGKLQRLIVSFENLCEEGKTPTPKLHGLILGLIGDARMIFNRDADRQPKEKVLAKLNGLKKNIDELLAQLAS